jgi:hypothetical protein
VVEEICYNLRVGLADGERANAIPTTQRAVEGATVPLDRMA